MNVDLSRCIFLVLFLGWIVSFCCVGVLAAPQAADPQAAGPQDSGLQDSGPQAAGSQDGESSASQSEVSEVDGSTAAPSAGPVVRVRVDSIIHPVVATFLVDSLAAADARGAAVFVLELDTPGGLLTSTRDIFEAMLQAETPVVVYVGPSGAQAASAGFFLLMAADVAAMAPGTNTGAAHPVGGQGEDIEGHMGEKIEQDSAAAIRSLAAQHGRDIELAEAAVIESRSFTADEALASGLVEIVAPSVTDLLTQLDGRRLEKNGVELSLATVVAPVEEIAMSPVQRFLAAIAHPNIAYMLMALGWIGVYVELTSPGGILPGVLGAIFLILGFYAMSVLPVNYAGVALIGLALVLFVAELYTATHGVLSLGGVVALVLGSVMLFDDVDPALQVGKEVIAGAVLGVVVVAGLLLRRAYQVRHSKVRTGLEGMVGERGVVRRELAPRGTVFVHGELWTAEAESDVGGAFVAAGSSVEVTAVEGLVVRVRPVEDISSIIRPGHSNSLAVE